VDQMPRLSAPADASKQTDVGLEEAAIAAIRRATRDRHAAVEAVLDLSPPLARRRYLDALCGFELFLSLWEPRIEAALPSPWHDGFASRSKLGLLRHDLAHLGQPTVREEGARRGCGSAVAGIELPGLAAVFGSLYVLEGSALGGQVIARSARTSLGLHPDNGAAYFNGLGTHTGARWTEFRRSLEEQVGTEPLARRQACTAACQTFDALIVTFTSVCRDHAAA
jgi:heme oxygenase